MKLMKDKDYLKKRLEDRRGKDVLLLITLLKNGQLEVNNCEKVPRIFILNSWEEVRKLLKLRFKSRKTIIYDNIVGSRENDNRKNY